MLSALCFGASSKGLQDGRARFASGARTTAQQRGEGWAVLRQRAAGRARHNSCMCRRWRPYRVEHTGSLLTSEVKRHRARLVLGWGTAREDLRVLPALHPVLASFPDVHAAGGLVVVVQHGRGGV